MGLKNKKRVANMAYTVSGKYGLNVGGGKSSHTDLKNITIHSDEVLAKFGLNEDETIALQLSASAHEGGHIKDSNMKAMVDYMTDMQTKGADLETANLVLQVCEDYRIDTNIEKERPGYHDMSRGTLKRMSEIFAKDQPTDQKRATHLALSALPYGVDYRAKGWRNNIPWDSIDDIVNTLKANVDDFKSTDDVAKFASDMYAKHFGFIPKINAPSDNKEQGDGDKEEEQEDMPSDTQGDKKNNEQGDEKQDKKEKQDGDDSDDADDGKDGSDDAGDTTKELSKKEITELVKAQLNTSLLQRMTENDAKLLGAIEKAKKEIVESIAVSDSVEATRKNLTRTYGRQILSKEKNEQLEEKAGVGMNTGGVIHYCESILKQELKDGEQLSWYGRGAKERKNKLMLEIRTLDSRAHVLADSIRTSMSLLETVVETDTANGKLTPNRVWKALHCNNPHVFRQKEEAEVGGFIVDLVVDASGSNSCRATAVGKSIYIIAKAFDIIGIPCRVTTFRTDGGFSILERLRDYYDPTTETTQCLSYAPDGANRDGHAYRAVYETSDKDPSLNHIMICVSDGQPSDTSGYISRSGGQGHYRNYHDENGAMHQSVIGSKNLWNGMDGTDDVAQTVRDIRSKGVALMGVFISDGDAHQTSITCEKLCFGNEFAHISNIKNLETIIAKYLKSQIEKTFQ